MNYKKLPLVILLFMLFTSVSMVAQAEEGRLTKALMATAVGIGKSFNSSLYSRYYEKYEYIGKYDITRMKNILGAEASKFTGGFSELITYPEPKYPVNLYRVIYRSIIPEKDNQQTIASGLLAIPETGAGTMPVVSYQHGTVFGKASVPSNPDNDNEYMETRIMVARFAAQGYIVVAADYFGKGFSQETDAFLVKASTQQACLDMLFAAWAISAKFGIQMGDLYLSGWSQGGWNTLAFLNKLESLNIPVEAAAIAAAPSDAFALINRWLHVTAANDPNYVELPSYTPGMLALLIHSHQDYYGLPLLSQTAIKPEYQQAAMDVYLGDAGAFSRLPTKLSDFLQDDFIKASSLGDNDFYTLLKDSPYRWRSKTPLRAYYGSADDVISPYLATIPVEYQKVMGGADAIAIKADIGNVKANHRGAFVYGVADQGEWFEQNANFNIVDTSQSLCYDNSTVINCPAAQQTFYGQDAQYSRNQPKYTVSTDGLTVYDHNTGLTWQRSPDSNGDGRITASDKFSLTEAEAYPATLNAQGFGGYRDWRLPTIKELYSLMDFRGTDPSVVATDASGLIPFIDTNYFTFSYGDVGAGERVLDAQYATKTRYVSKTFTNTHETMFGVNFGDGRIKGYPITIKTFYTLCVRGNGYGNNKFVDNHNQTVTDQATGLMWTKMDSGIGMNWQQALNWVQVKNAANYLGYSDWRLPNAKELQGIVDYTRSPDTTDSAAIDPVFFSTAITNELGQKDYAYYWTNTTHASSDGTGKWAVYVAFGRGMGYFKGEWQDVAVWQDVHGAGVQRSDPKTGNPADYPQGHGPQGDAIRINNYVRLVRVK